MWVKRKLKSHAVGREKRFKSGPGAIDPDGGTLAPKVSQETAPKSAPKSAPNEPSPESAPKSAPNEPAPKESAPKAPAPKQKETIIMDYQRDICTQYFKTGRCRYGDNCKFVHDRGSKKEDKKEVKETVVEDKNCALCNAPDPEMVPKCGHRYCEECFLKQAKNGVCVCGKDMRSAKSVNVQ